MERTKGYATDERFDAKAGECYNPRSYRVDADLSPEGEKYAERLKNFVLHYRQEKLKSSSKSENQQRPLTVRIPRGSTDFFFL